MDLNRKHKVSLRGASSGEISRDALLAKVSQERELRSYTRRANAATLYIQRVWRSYIVRKKAAIEIQEEWENLLSCQSDTLTKSWVSSRVLRPFLFFIRSLFCTLANAYAQQVGFLSFRVSCSRCLLLMS